MVESISILIPIYYPDVIIVNQILSILERQTFPNFEAILLIDDCKTEGSAFETNNDKRISIVKNKENLGLYWSIFSNLERCKSDYILILEQDIIPLGDRFLENMANILEKERPEIVTSTMKLAKNSSYRKFIYYKRRIGNLTFISGSEQTRKNTQLSNVEMVLTKADLLKRTLLNELSKIQSSDRNFGQDMILSYLAGSRGKILSSELIACEIGKTDPDSLYFYMKKEFMYGKSALKVLKKTGIKPIRGKKFFKERLLRIAYLFCNAIVFSLILISLAQDNIYQVLSESSVLLLINLIYPYYTMRKINFNHSSIYLKGGRKRNMFLGALFILLLDISYTMGVLVGIRKYN